MKTLIGIITFVLIVGSGVSIRNSIRRADVARQELDAAAARQREMEGRIATVRRRIQEAEQTAAELRSELATAQTEQRQRAAAAVKPQPPASGTASQNATSLPVLLDRDPKLRELYRAQFQADAALRYLPFFHRMGLSPEQQRRFLELLTELQETRLDIEAVAAAQQLSPAAPQLAELQKNAVAGIATKQKELLGEDGFTKMRQFQSIMVAQNAVNDVSSLVAADGAPLNIDQATRLLEAFGRAKTDGPPGLGGFQVDPAKVEAEAVTFLSPRQFAALKAELGFQRIGTLSTQFYAQQSPTAPKAQH